MKNEALDFSRVSLKKSARVEYIAVENFVFEKHSAGYTVKSIWKGLHDGGYVTMSYARFCQYVLSSFEDRRVIDHSLKPSTVALDFNRASSRADPQPAPSHGFSEPPLAAPVAPRAPVQPQSSAVESVSISRPSGSDTAVSAPASPTASVDAASKDLVTQSGSTGPKKFNHSPVAISRDVMEHGRKANRGIP